MLDKTLKDLEFQEAKITVQRELALKKAIASDNADDIVKAQNYWLQKQKTDKDTGKGLIVDPQQTYLSSNGYIEKNFNISFQVLRQMSRTPVPRAIIGTRKEQVAEFCSPQRDKYSPGFIIRKKNTDYYGNGGETNNSKEDIKTINKLTDFVLNCGDNSNKWHGDDFESMIRKLVQDSLSFDQYTFEVIRNRKGQINEFLALDAATIRVADTYDSDSLARNNTEMKKVNGYYPSHVQVYQSRVMADFYPWDLCFGVRNPQSDLFSNNYGRSELEDLISTVTSLLNADAYNSNYFKIGSNPKGILRVKNLNTSRLEEFRSQWMAEMAGVQNSHKMPILDADKVDFITTQQSNKDMEYGKYYEFLLKIACAIYTISPEEIGFPLEGSGGGLGNGDNKTELEYSKSKGLYPLLRNLEKSMNKYIVGPASENEFEFVFVGLRERTAEAELEMQVKEVQYLKTVNEVRKARGDKEIDGGDIILNPIFFQAEQAKATGEQQESNDYMDSYVDEEEDEDYNPFMKSLQTFVNDEL